MNTRQIKAIRKLFLAYGQPGTVEIHATVHVRENPRLGTSSEWVPVKWIEHKHRRWYSTKSLGSLKQLPVSTGYLYSVRWSTPDMDTANEVEVICTDLTDLKNPKFAIYKEESANAPA